MAAIAGTDPAGFIGEKAKIPRYENSNPPPLSYSGIA